MKRLLLSAFLLLNLCSHAQLHSVECHSDTFYSSVYDTLRVIDVAKPVSMTPGDLDNATILYVFDAQFSPYFELVLAEANYLYALGEFPAFIAVGIHTQHRPREFTPPPVNDSTRTGWGDVEIGGSGLLTSFLKEEVFHRIEQSYTPSTIRLGIGHSLGGTFTSQSIFSNSGLFKGVISISPNTIYDYRQLPINFEYARNQNALPKAFHYITAGGVGNMENRFRVATEYLDSLYRTNPVDGLIWEYRLFPELGHSHTPQPSIHYGLKAWANHISISQEEANEWISDSEITYVEAVNKHFVELSEWFGSPYLPPVEELNTIAYYAGWEEKWAEALPVMEFAIEKYPLDANLRDSRGEALENLGQLKEAMESYQDAIDLLTAHPDQYDPETRKYYSETFEANRKRVKELLEGSE
mgnify:CR=1 FL=1